MVRYKVDHCGIPYLVHDGAIDPHAEARLELERDRKAVRAVSSRPAQQGVSEMNPVGSNTMGFVVSQKVVK